MGIKPLNEDTGARLLDTIDNIAFTVRVSEYGYDQVACGAWTQDDMKTYLKRSQETLNARRDVLIERKKKGEAQPEDLIALYEWPDKTSNSLFTDSVNEAAQMALATRMYGGPAKEAQQAAAALQSIMQQARSMHASKQLRTETLIGFYALAAAAASDKPLAIMDAYAAGKQALLR